MPTNITSDQLRIIAQFISLFPPPFYNSVTSFLNDLYVTGCRPQELLQVDRWSTSIIDSNYWTLQPQKGNDTRQILKASLSDNLNYAIVNNIKPYQSLSLRQLEYSISQVNPVGRLYAADKVIIAYLYRYNKVREMLNNGMTQDQISAAFGWVAPTIVASYTTKQIGVADYIIPDETFFLSDANNDILVDSDGTFIISEAIADADYINNFGYNKIINSNGNYIINT